MSAVAEISITGIAEIRQRLSPEVFRATLVSAVRAALRPVASGVSAAAPRQSGRLAGSIKAVVSTRGQELRAAIVAGTGYGHLVEYGHRMVIGGRVSRGGFVPLSRRGRFKGTVVGQVPPHPFARPAFQAQQEQVARVIEQRLAAAISG